jgi:FkbM family methyltransferase
MKYYSQYEQDKIIMEAYFKNKTDGFFVEIGADDGVRFSNCKSFEDKGWKGIAFEPRKEAFQKLKQNRTCECLNLCLSDEERIVDFLDIKGYGLGLSGLIEKYDPRHLSRIGYEIQHPDNQGKEIVKVKTKMLCDVLEERNITHIDFLSIDTEGSELNILSTIDFDKIKIDVITIEDNYDDPKLMEFFLKRGYKHVMNINCDKVFKVEHL